MIVMFMMMLIYVDGTCSVSNDTDADDNANSSRYGELQGQ